MWRRLVILGLSCMVVSGPLFMNRYAEALTTQVVISSIKTDGANTLTTPATEYVDLTNVSDQTIDLTGWQLVYAQPTTVIDENCRTTDWADGVTSLDLSGSLEIDQSARFAIRMLDDKSGAVRLIDSEGTVQDLVGWGNQAKCAEGSATDIPGDHEILQRCTIDGQLQDSDNNTADFSRTADDVAVPSCPDIVPSPDPGPLPDYPGLQITELLPDPASPQSDSHDEFIELYNNQTFAVSTKDYVLHASGSSASYSYTMPDITLQPGEYRAFYSAETGLSLVNSTAYAWLTDPGGKIVDETSWYSDLGADNAWALINGAWRLTNNLTPSAPNRPASVGGFGAETTNNVILKSCPAGKYRNPETNRCKAIALTSASLVACKPGQQRNQATNRCRDSTTTGKVLAACAPDQQRNPSTNRCRKIASGINHAAVAASSAADTANTVSKLNYKVLGLISSAALGYGIYEYRQDALHTLLRIRNRLGRSRLLK